MITFNDEEEDMRPPLPFLEQIAKNCPIAMDVYLQLWQMKSPENKMVVYKDDIGREFKTSVKHFNSSLQKLAREGLLHKQDIYTISGEQKYLCKVMIALVSWEELQKAS